MKSFTQYLNEAATIKQLKIDLDGEKVSEKDLMDFIKNQDVVTLEDASVKRGVVYFSLHMPVAAAKATKLQSDLEDAFWAQF